MDALGPRLDEGQNLRLVQFHHLGGRVKPTRTQKRLQPPSSFRCNVVTRAMHVKSSVELHAKNCEVATVAAGTVKQMQTFLARVENHFVRPTPLVELLLARRA